MILPQFEEMKKFSVKHDLLIGRDMPETCRQKKSNKRLGLVENCCYFSIYSTDLFIYEIFKITFYGLLRSLY